jgi:hypothetical protein
MWPRNTSIPKLENSHDVEQGNVAIDVPWSNVNPWLEVEFVMKGEAMVVPAK